MKLGQGASWYFSGNVVQARRVLEGGLRLTDGGHPIVRIGMLTFRSFAATDEGHTEEAESLARGQSAGRQVSAAGDPPGYLAPIALGRALAGHGKLEEELESAYSARQSLPGLSLWPTLVGLLALAPVRAARGDRAGARTVLAEARGVLDDNPDAGMFPEFLERQERKLRARKSREGQPNGELTERERDVLRLFGGELSTRQMAQSLYAAPSTVRTQVKSIYRKLGVSSRAVAVEAAQARGSSSLPHRPINPLGEMRWWVMTDQPVAHYARGLTRYGNRR